MKTKVVPSDTDVRWFIKFVTAAWRKSGSPHYDWKQDTILAALPKSIRAKRLWRSFTEEQAKFIVQSVSNKKTKNMGQKATDAEVVRFGRDIRRRWTYVENPDYDQATDLIRRHVRQDKKDYAFFLSLRSDQVKRLIAVVRGR